MKEAAHLGREELAQLYQRYGHLVLKRAARILGDEHLARDVCHDVFVQVMRAQPWAPPSPLAWLYLTTTNLSLNVLRSRRRGKAAVAAMASPSSSEPAGEASTLLGRIPPELQELAVYYAVDQLSQEEIAQVMGISQKTVSNRLRRLRELLDPPDETPATAVREGRRLS